MDSDGERIDYYIRKVADGVTCCWRLVQILFACVLLVVLAPFAVVGWLFNPDGD